MNHLQEQSDGHRAALVAGFLGWTFVAFDFFLVVVTLTAIAREFHRPDKAIALSIALTLGFRPVGALIFGLIADRYGRRPPLMFVLVFYSVIEVLSGLAPNYATFMVLRSLFGIGMGAQWGLGASLAMEKVPRGRRGVLSGLLQEGYAVGYLLAAICSLMTSVATLGITTVWLGWPLTVTAEPPNVRFVTRLEPEAPPHVAREWASTTAAVTCAA